VRQNNRPYGEGRIWRITGAAAVGDNLAAPSLPDDKQPADEVPPLLKQLRGHRQAVQRQHDCQRQFAAQLRPNAPPPRDAGSAAAKRTCSDKSNDLPEHFRTIVKLLISTGQRRGEMAALRTSFIEADRITLPATVVKNKRQHTFPIAKLALKPLRSTQSNSARDDSLFFPARGKLEKPFNGWSKAKVATRQNLRCDQLDAARPAPDIPHDPRQDRHATPHCRTSCQSRGLSL
jgi:integrase